MKAKERLAAGRSAMSLLLLGVVLIVAFKLIGDQYLGGFFFDLGSPGMPSTLYIAFLALWSFFGLAAGAAFTLGFVGLLSLGPKAAFGGGSFSFGSDRGWIVAAVVLGFLIPVAIHFVVLDGAPLTDDESAYMFSAQLLAEGRLVGESPPEKLFFDRSFMINDGRFYSQYFLGWPALIVPFLWLGIPGLANAVIAALTGPGVFLVARRFAGGEAARLATLLYLASPFLMIAAATGMSHTSCLAALVWLTWAVQRSFDDDAGPRVSVLVGLLFCVAFFIRPLTAVGLGAPLLIWWALGMWRRGPTGRLRFVAAFAFPCVLLGGLFLVVNLLQNGSITQTAYQQALDYARSNGFRFTHWNEGTSISVPLDPGRIKVGTANAGVALLRLNGAMFGWPMSFLLVPLAWRARGAGVLWASIVTFMVCHLTMINVGIDSFGPVHYMEVTWPVILLSAIGIVRLRDHLASTPSEGGVDWRRAPVVAVFVLLALGLTCYMPPRLGALRAMTEVINRAFDTPERLGVQNAIIFAPRFITSNCDKERPRSFVHWRPNPDPRLEDSIVWANHITVDDDRRLMARFPGRKGYIFGWAKGCQGALIALDDPASNGVPPGQM